MKEAAAVEITALETTGCERISRHGAAANRCCASRSNRRGAEAAASETASHPAATEGGAATHSATTVETASTATAAMEAATAAKTATVAATPSTKAAASRGAGRRQNGNRSGCQ